MNAEAPYKVRVKHSPGLGGWVVYVGWEFVDGAFARRSDAERAARNWDVVAAAEVIRP